MKTMPKKAYAGKCIACGDVVLIFPIGKPGECQCGPWKYEDHGRLFAVQEFSIHVAESTEDVKQISATVHYRTHPASSVH